MSKPKRSGEYVGDDLAEVNIITTEYLYAIKKAPQGLQRYTFRDIKTGTRFQIVDYYNKAKNTARRWARDNGYLNIMLEAPE